MRLLAIIVGIGPRWSYVDVDDETVTVRMGWAFFARIPRSSLASVGPHRRVWWAIGVHFGRRGSWIVNGTAGNLVELGVSPPARGRGVLFPIRIRRLLVSVEQPSELIAQLSPG